METLAPSVQTEAEGLEGVGETTQTATSPGEPLISGPAPYLWAGVGAALLIFIVGMMLIIRGRVTHAKPQRRKKGEKGEKQSYFEPAGEDADITFDDDDMASPAVKHDDRWRDEVSDTEVVIEHGQEHTGQEHTGQDDLAPTPPARPEKKKSAFAGLFSKKPAPESEPSAENDDLYTAHEDDRNVGFFADEAEPAAGDHWPEPDDHAGQAIPAEPARHPADIAAEHQRIAHAEEAAQAALRRAEEAESLARDLKRANEEAQNVMSLGLRKQEAALSERTEALMAMEKRLASLSDEFHNRMDAMPAALAAAPHAAGLHEAPAGVSEDHFAEFANLMGEQFDALRSTVNGAIERLSKRLDHLPSAPAGAGTATAARVQLSDLLGDALAPQRFKLAQKLSTGRTADAIILMPGPMAPLAIDARFPAEAFDAWQMSRNPGSETDLRRAVLRNIADAGEKLIAPEETADCALMFIPSEHILSELHASFSDLVQESYRARVWMVSPTSLMATLHTISAVMAGAGIREASAVNVIDELHDLRGRVSALETTRPPNGAHPKPDAAIRAGEEQQSERASPPEKLSDIMSSPRHADPAPPKAPGDKSPFPLR